MPPRPDGSQTSLARAFSRSVLGDVIVRDQKGIEITHGDARVLLDPQRAKPRRRAPTTASGDEESVSVPVEGPDPFRAVTHAHSDHLAGDAVMTPPTLDFLRIRKPRATGTSAPYGERIDHDGIGLTFHDAGHILGSAMIEVDIADRRILYTGDFSMQDGLTCASAKARKCDVLITESTYGEPRFVLPPRDLVIHNLVTWIDRKMLRGSVALGAHQLGRAQELIALANSGGMTPIVSVDIAQTTAVYNAHGHDLSVIPMGSPREQEQGGSNHLYIVPRNHMKKGHDFARRLRDENGAGAYVSGWCQVYSYFNSYDIDAQFPLSDHATFPDLIDFAQDCDPELVLTTHGKADVLAREIEKRVGVTARAL